MKELLLMVMTIVIGKPMTVTSTAFKNNGNIPFVHTCDGMNTSPALSIKDIPSEAKTLALIMDDPDAPNGTFDHWLMWNIPVKETIEENTATGTQGKNGRGIISYIGPCPPSGTHHYHFRIYALDTNLNLKAGSNKDELKVAMEGHILAEAELIGLYKKK